MTNQDKAKKVDAALGQLSSYMLSHKLRVDDASALIAFEAIQNFVFAAPDESKARLFDIMTSN